MLQSDYKTVKLVNLHTHHTSDVNITVLQGTITNSPSHKQLYSLGIHPLEDIQENTILISDNAKHLTNPHCIAIGESGFDNRSSLSTAEQIERFRKQMQLSVDYDLPMIIHCVGRWNELERMFKEKSAGSPAWILHGFRKTQLAETFLGLGAYLSFGKALLYDERLQASISSIPMDRIFLETDDEKFELITLYEKLAVIKSLPLQTVVEQVYANFRDVFTRITNG